DGIARVDVFGVFDPPPLPGSKPVNPESPHPLPAVVDPRQGHSARRRIPDDLGIEVLPPHLVGPLGALRREPLREFLHDRHVLLRHRHAVSPDCRFSSKAVISIHCPTTFRGLVSERPDRETIEAYTREVFAASAATKRKAMEQYILVLAKGSVETGKR